MNAFDRMRRNRNNVEYPPIGGEEIAREEVEDDFEIVDQALEKIATLLRTMPVF